MNVLAEGPDEGEGRRVVVVEREMFDSAVKLSRVVDLFRTEVVDLGADVVKIFAVVIYRISLSLCQWVETNLSNTCKRPYFPYGHPFLLPHGTTQYRCP